MNAPQHIAKAMEEAIDAQARPLAVVEATAPKIAIAPPLFAQPRSIAEIKQIGELLLQSGFFKDVRSLAQCCTKIMAGAALGYDVVTSMNAFHIIEGKISPTAGEVSARIKRSGKYRLKSWFIDDKGNRVDTTKPDAAVSGAVVQVFENWDDHWEALEPSVFTRQDATAAGLIGKDVWKKYFRNMSYARALTNAARWHCADVFGGPVYTPEELGANVDIIEGEMIVFNDPPEDPKPVQSHPATDAAPSPQSEERAIKALRQKIAIQWSNAKVPEEKRHAALMKEYGKACYVDGKPSLRGLSLVQLKDFDQKTPALIEAAQ